MSREPFVLAEWRPDTPPGLPGELGRVIRVKEWAEGAGTLAMGLALLALLSALFLGAQAAALSAIFFVVGAVSSMVMRSAENAGARLNPEDFRYGASEVTRIQHEVVQHANTWLDSANPADTTSQYPDVAKMVAQCEEMRGQVTLMDDKIAEEASTAGAGWQSPTSRQRDQVVSRMRQILAQMTMLAEAAKQYRAHAIEWEREQAQRQVELEYREELHVLEAAEAIYADNYEAVWSALGDADSRAGLPSPAKVAQMRAPLGGFATASLTPSIEQSESKLVRLDSESLDPEQRRQGHEVLDRIKGYAACISAGIARINAKGDLVPVLPEVDAERLRMLLSEQHVRIVVESELAQVSGTSA